MTRELMVYERLYHDKGGRKYRLQYYLLTDEVYFGVNTLEIYGAKVAQFRDGEFLMQRSIRGITPFSTRIMTVLNRLSDALTEPEGMEKMIYDEVGVV